MRIEPAQLDLHHAEGARVLAGGLLREAEEALLVLESGASEEALHDLRVALRRVRSLLRALRPSLAGSVRRKHERRLGAIAAATSAARDAEVQAGWLGDQRAGASPRDVAAIEAIVARLEEERREGYRLALQDGAARFRRLAGRLHRRLAHPVAGAGAGPSLAEVLSEALRALAATLFSRLDRVRGPFDVEGAHAARIAAKRLRYALEPLRGGPRADSGPVVGALKELQDLLGELHDAHVLGGVVGAALVDAAADRARRAHAAILEGESGGRVLRLASRDGLTRGLLSVDLRVAERAAAAFTTLSREWLPARREALRQGVDGVADALSPRKAGRAGAVRRFLLLQSPEEVADVPEAVLEKGWLPGPSPRRWLLRIEGSGSPQHLRGGGQSGEAEQEIPPEAFAALWPETAGARHLKRRRVVVRGGQTWSIDAHGEGGPFVAHVAAPLNGAVELPRWLARAVVREVTDERAYDDERIAARRHPTAAAPAPEPGRPDP
jgi:CHAD domain-containing protein